jgi:serine/threonine-protein kinase
MMPHRPDSAPVGPGETIAGKYRIEHVIGQGGMGVVVAARHLELQQRVAIKFLLAAPDEASVVRFLREARAAAKVNSDHVCRVFDFGRLETDEPYLVMDYLEGEDLVAVLARERPIAPERAVGWILEACDAVASAHALGIVHRDIKPANLFLAKRPNGTQAIKVLDFGISKVLGVTVSDSVAFVGTPLYMSPEQIEGARDIDGRTDIWSLGATLYELLAGTPPFETDSIITLVVKIRETAVDPLDERNPAVPRGLAAVVERCLEKRKEDRYASIADLVTALSPFAPHASRALVARAANRPLALAATTPVDPPFPIARPLPWRPLAIGIAGLAIGGAAVALLQRNVRTAPIVPTPSASASASTAPSGALPPVPSAMTPAVSAAPPAASATATSSMPPRPSRPPVHPNVVAPSSAPMPAVPPTSTGNKGHRDLDRDEPR